MAARKECRPVLIIFTSNGTEAIWEQVAFDQTTHDSLNYIHFVLSDGSRIEKAFVYDWRLWTLPEISDALQEAGFDQVSFYNRDLISREKGDFSRKRCDDLQSDTYWIADIVAIK